MTISGNPLFVIPQDFVFGPCVERRKSIYSPQYVLELFSHYAPTAPPWKPLQTFLESMVNRFSEGLSRFLSELPS